MGGRYSKVKNESTDRYRVFMTELVQEFIENYCTFEKAGYTECNTMYAAFNSYLQARQLFTVTIPEHTPWLPEFQLVFRYLLPDVSCVGGVIFRGIVLKGWPHKDDLDGLRLRVLKNSDERTLELATGSSVYV
jgi:hypothetical protein